MMIEQNCAICLESLSREKPVFNYYQVGLMGGGAAHAQCFKRLQEVRLEISKQEQDRLIEIARLRLKDHE